MAVGTAIGTVMGRPQRVDMTLDGILVLGLDIPALVTIILCHLWFGLTKVAAVILLVEAVGMRPLERRLTRWRS